MSQAISAAAHPVMGNAKKDARLQAFCTPGDPEIFHSVCHRHEICWPDPYDVPVIHEEARRAFERLLQRATTPKGTGSGRILLLLGESGSGKTHLMRAFRNQVHGGRLGYCGYMQMTSLTNNYGRYMLGNLIDALDQPYSPSEGETTSLMRLANALVESSQKISPGDRERLREGELDASSLSACVRDLADALLSDERYRELDLDLTRALLFLQRDDARIKSRVLKYLRCEDLSEEDRKVFAGLLVPRPHEEDPQRMVEMLGRLMWMVQHVSLVMCIDQLEEMYNLDEAEVRFRRAMGTVCATATNVPSSIVVISCLEDYYRKLRAHLTQPVLDRIERDPEPIRLNAHRSEQEIIQLVARRLAHLYEERGAAFDERDPAYPLPPAQLRQLTNLRTRDILDWCREYRNRCIEAQELVAFDSAVRPPVEASEPATVPLQQAWNDLHATYAGKVPDAESELAGLLSWAIRGCSQEMEDGTSFAAEVDGRVIEVETHGPDNQVELLVVAVCNKATQGGGLVRQVRDVVKRAGEHRLVLVRSTAFPSNPRTQVVQEIGAIVSRGGRRVVVEDADWRTMLACQAFEQKHRNDQEYERWLREERPLSRMLSLRAILDLDRAKPALANPIAPSLAEESTAVAPSPARENAAVAQRATMEPAAPSAPTPEPDALLAGVSSGRMPAPIRMHQQELTRHAAFLGGSGSGKTTVALNIIEQVLLRGIPAVLVDRKGDLCGYARPDVWTKRTSESELEERRLRLRDIVDVRLYTPGNPHGNPLSIPLVPRGMDQIDDSWDREQVAGYAAYALGGMMAYRDKGQDASRVAILRQAIALLSGPEIKAEVTVDELLKFISDQDPALLTAIGQLDPKLFKKLVQDLQTLRLNKGSLLASEGERLDTENLLGLGPYARPGKTRLSIISTKFLGDNANVEFWVAQLLLEVMRWSSKHPADKLQAVILFDEADMYLPAQRKPATKEPMEYLLKRARSAGLGLLLASQSPGDFDYKCRDTIRAWFLGRITQQTSLVKMRPMLSECKEDISARLPSQETGQFYLIREKRIDGLRADRSLLTTEQLAEEEILELARARRA